MEERDNSAADSHELKTVIQQVLRETMASEQAKAEPAYKTELVEERRRREALERRVNELVKENERSRAMAEEADRQSTIRAELQRQGVQKLDLAFKAIRDDVKRSAEGRLMANTEAGELPLTEYVSKFVQENPEFLPARVGGGSGAASLPRENNWQQPASIDLDRVKPGMDREELERVRQEVARFAQQSRLGR